MAAILKVTDLNKEFTTGKNIVKVLKGVYFELQQGDFTMLLGPSGSGKSTILHIILGLEPPTSGEVVFLNQNLFTLPTDDDRAEFRRKHIGMVYQQSNWIKSLSVIDNVAFPLTLSGIDKFSAQKVALEKLAEIGLEQWAHYYPSELSGGQQQRVAVARALVSNPEVIIADEPTGNLDYMAGKKLMELLVVLNKTGKTVIMVTHDLEYAAYASSAIQIFDGEVVDFMRGIDKTRILKNFQSKKTITTKQTKNDKSAS